MLQAMRTGASSTIIKYILFSFLILATFGLVLTDVGGFFRGGGFTSRDVANAGQEKISLPEFDRDLRRALSRLGIPPQEAYKLGFVDQFLSGEIRARLLELAAADHGIAISKPVVARQVMQMIQPMTGPDRSAADVLKTVLMNQGMSEADLTAAIRREMATGIIGGTVQSGFSTLPDDLVRDLYKIDGETRSIEYVFLSDDAARKDVAAPADDDLKKLYESTREQFAIPETRALDLVVVKEDALKKSVAVTDEELRQYYESNKDSFAVPPMRRIEQALVNDEKQAASIHDKIKAGAKMERAVRDVTGGPIAYLGPQEIEDTKIVEDIRPAVLAAKAGELLPPLKSSLGYHIVKVEKIIPAGQRPFEDVKADLKTELMESRLADARDALAASIDDQFAGGASTADVAKNGEVEIITLPVVNAFGQGKDGKNALEKFEKIAPAILKAGFDLAEGETSPVTGMEDGRMAAVHVRAITRKTYRPFEEVKAQLATQWTADQARANNRSTLKKALEDIKAGTKKLADIGGVKTMNALPRNAQDKKPLSAESIAAIFSATSGETFVFEGIGGAGVGVVTKIAYPEKIDPGSKAFKEFRGGIIGDTQAESMSVYIEALNRKYGSGINRPLLDQAYGAKPEDSAP